MRRLLQSIIYNRKLYDRPQDEWTCGRAAEGCPCVFGPGARGECRATSQCLPAKKGDRWVCTRAISLGAACSPGPLPDGACGCPVPPCRPVRSLRGRRARLSWLAATGALGIVILTLWGGAAQDWTNPGPLTSQHATSAQRCADCHVEPVGLNLTSAAATERRAAHDRLCLACHELGPHSRSPHGASTAQLTLLCSLGKSRSTPTHPTLAAGRKMVQGIETDLACAACHQEHHGQDFSLTKMSNQQCQVCHQAQFDSFSHGHPEFVNYPEKRRTRVRFDHTAHLQNHFLVPELAARAPTSCSSCHEPEGNGRQMLVRGFEQSCARCHSPQIDGAGRAGDKGLVFFRLPGVDTDALRAAGEAIGEWPAFAEGDLTPFMRWMMEGDAKAQHALAALGPIKLSDLSSANPSQRAAAAELVWSVKGLFADLVTQGQQVIMHRMGAAAVPALPGRRTGQLPADGLLAAQQSWLPHLLGEVAAYRRGEKPALPSRASAAGSTPAEVAAVKPKSAGDDDLLAAPDNAAATPKPVTAASTDDLLTSDPAPAAGAPAPAATAPSLPPPTSLAMGDVELRVAEGGWYRRDETFALYYRPGGHADSFLTAWLNATAGDKSTPARAIFAQLSDPQAPGLCIKCHSIDNTKTSTIVNWLAARPQPNHHEFTTFKHSAHFSLMGDQGCKTCHALAPAAAYASAFGANRDPAVFISNFAPLKLNACAVCHQPGIAGDSCLQCHNYHTGDLQTLRAPSADFHRRAPKAN